MGSVRSKWTRFFQGVVTHLRAKFLFVGNGRTWWKGCCQRARRDKSCKFGTALVCQSRLKGGHSVAVGKDGLREKFKSCALVRLCVFRSCKSPLKGPICWGRWLLSLIPILTYLIPVILMLVVSQLSTYQPNWISSNPHFRCLNCIVCGEFQTLFGKYSVRGTLTITRP